MLYSNYLQTEHWKTTRNKKIEEHNWCSVCKSTEKLVVHHKRYKDRTGKSLLFNEESSVLVPLCHSCHRLVHHYFGINVKKLNKRICRIRRLMELNILKNKAFWITTNDELYISIIKKLHSLNRVKGSRLPSTRKSSAILHAYTAHSDA